MKNEYYAFSMTSSSPTSDFIAHYGVMGMKWGVRKAIAKGNQRALDRHFRKAAKKLSKLQDIGLNSGKYAAKATAYGAAAVGTGTVAIGGPSGLAGHLRNKVTRLKAYQEYAGSINNAEAYKKYADQIAKTQKKADDVEAWGKSASGLKRKVKTGEYTATNGVKVPIYESKDISKGSLLRVGSGAAALGLGAAAAVNAYRAANPQKYRQKAVEFKNEMDRSFAGTKYAGQYVAQPRVRKRKRR